MINTHMFPENFGQQRPAQATAGSLPAQPGGWGRRKEQDQRRCSTAKRLALIATLTMLTTGGVAAAAAPSGSTQSTAQHPADHTPNSCILLNRGDYNACNVGNSGRGDLPYKIARHHTPNNCILLNGGDYNACNVGNSGRGDLPYRPAH